MKLAGGVHASLGSYLLRRSSRHQSIRQQHVTGPQYHKRRRFHFAKGIHQLHRRVAPANVTGSPTQQVEHRRYQNLPGDVRTRPQEDYTFGIAPQSSTAMTAASPYHRRQCEGRVDKAMYAWKPRGGLQLHQMGGAKETFVCFRCGYPVRSQLVAVERGNWDYRMCYNCYVSVARLEQQNRDD